MPMRQNEESDESEVECGENDVVGIIYNAAYNAFRDALAESDLEGALIEGVRTAADELLEQFMSQKTWMFNRREN